MIRVHRYWNLMPEIPVDPLKVDSAMSTLPINQIMNVLRAPPSDFDNFVNRLPNDPRWKDTEFGTQDDHNSAPMLYDQLLVRHVDRSERRDVRAPGEARGDGELPGTTPA